MIKSLHLRYDEKTHKSLEKLKDRKGLSWENWVLWLAENYNREVKA